MFGDVPAGRPRAGTVPLEGREGWIGNGVVTVWYWEGERK